MKTYHIAAQVAHSGKHLDYTVAAYYMSEALTFFDLHLHNIGLSFDALSEVDVSEVVG